MTFSVYYAVRLAHFLDTPYTREALGNTHRKVRELTVEATSVEAGLEQVYIQMQGEVWSPNGEARPLIEELELTHTSMSVSDVVVDEQGGVWTCMSAGFAKAEEPVDSLATFGPVISRYTRAQAIDDGVLVDVSKWAKGYFKISVAMTIEAFHEVFKLNRDATHNSAEAVKAAGIAHDLFTVMQFTIRAQSESSDRIDFRLKVRGRNVDLYAVVGGGDGGEPVMTIMQPGQD